MERLADPFAVIALIITVIATALPVLVLWDTWHYHRRSGYTARRPWRRGSGWLLRWNWGEAAR